MLTVGPESAGSTPGPACYGRGGTRPTMTDAFATCGIIGHGNIGYDAVSVDVDKARAAVGTVATKLGRGLEQAAEAIIQVAVSGMYREVGKLASRQGIDPRDFTLLAFGGAGPMLGCFLARELGMHQVLIPTAPGVLSALGGLVADVKNDFISTAYYPLSADELPRLKADFDHLAPARVRLDHRGAEVRRFVRAAARRRHALPGAIVRDRGAAAAGLDRSRRHRAHRRGLPRRARPPVRPQLRRRRRSTWSACAWWWWAARRSPRCPAEPRRTGSPVPAKQIDVYLDGAWRKVPLYRRADLGHGHRLPSPCVVAQEDTTICVPEGFAGTVDAYGNILLSLGE